MCSSDKTARANCELCNRHHFWDGLEHAEQDHAHEHICQEEEPIVLGAVSARNPSSEKSIKPVRKLASVNELEHVLDDGACSDMTASEIRDIGEMIERLGGSLVDPYDFPESVSGLQDYLDQSGVISRFSAEEMVRPNNPAAARSCGEGSELMPPRCRWLSGAVQGLIASELRAVINDGDAHGARPIALRNWWRPSCYNRAVGGAGASDHIQARGFDLDFSTPQERARAQDLLCQMYKENPFNLQVGIGCQTLHIGVGSPKRLSQYPSDGSRFWTYSSINSCALKRLSTDDCWVRDRGGRLYIHPDAHSPRSATSGSL